ncbi:methionyl-tRNA formyltransferase [Modestobacter sp. VKM Ac-2979]|uniref:methionyl-tRNA formyltransferase n=1 Tax=unclassified Modestobacter TaxID=2643866 RepID=UPI0022AB6AF0|nr:MULTISPECIES: methionyl-tRNA formyltransferase [unclassified Modestobacter]MCZ2812821.1 methionyl-tRNA formyltransferase [Modestobacter sp. VKM Ac-2979]MCZ2843150.1 methionyl-tRNA formyltransferase [Modestobacter sp. VKM Ac-2980]
MAGCAGLAARRVAGAGTRGEGEPPLRLLFAGTPAPAVVALDALLDSAHEVVAVLTRPDAPSGRGRRTSRSPVAERADAAGIPVLQPRSPREPEFLSELADLAVDCAPVVAYGALVPPAALQVPRHGWVNLHFSLLPAWRGAAPVQHAIMAGDEVTGAATFQLEAGLDTGPVLGVVTEPIGATDTAGDLLDRLAVSGARLLVATLDGIADGSLRPEPQPAEGVSLAPRIETADAQVDWTLPAHVVDRRVRGVTPAPGAWTTWRGNRLRLAPVEPLSSSLALEPGELSIGSTGVLVGAGRGAVRLSSVQPAGKKMLPAADWARGARLEPGERLGEQVGA